jgi:thymidylate kinase
VLSICRPDACRLVDGIFEIVDMITIITGAPGSGKTTLSALLSSKVEKGAHIPSDLFYSFIPHRVPPHLPEADAQNHVVISAIMKAAKEYAAQAYDVFVDGIFGPWFLAHIATELLPTLDSIHYVILDISVETAIARIRARQDKLDESIVIQMSSEFKNHASGYLENLLPVEGKSNDQIVDEIIDRRETGKYLIRLQNLFPD